MKFYCFPSEVLAFFLSDVEYKGQLYIAKGL